MIAAMLIVFREVLESSLIISIVMAAARGMPRRNLWVGSGIAAGVAGAGLVAAFASALSNAAEGMGMELFNAIILGLAVLMLGWHNIWMASHGRAMAKEAGEIGRAVHDGRRPMYALAIVVGVAVLREGSETVLFLYGILASGQDAWWVVASGGLLGVALGCALGVALYLGMVRIPLKQLFAVSGGMILLLACGLAAQCVGLLVQADILPPLGTAIWDTSGVLTETSILGKVLHTLVGYVARPDGIQLLAYVATCLTIGGCMRLFKHKPKLVIVGLALALATTAMPEQARAEFQVRSPIVDYHELEIEHNGSTTFDSQPDRRHANSDTIEVGYGFTPWWKLELEGETEAAPQKDHRYIATTIENYFQLTPQGKYWADVGIFAEYSRASRRSEGDAFEFGPMVQKETAGFAGHSMLHTVNLFVSQGVGNGGTHDTGISYAAQSRLQLNPLFEPGVEIYGGADNLDHTGSFSEQQHRAGPMFAGAYNLADSGLTKGKVKYELGYLLPLTHVTEDGALRWRMEYELPF